MTQTSDEKREYQRRYRAANADSIRENQRRYREGHRESARERTRLWIAANPERAREYQRQNQPRRTAQYRVNRHGVGIDDAVAAMWTAQGGCCYLCEKPLVKERAVIDHDHLCCGENRSCGLCRRGLACSLCNVLIGAAHDDPQQLRKIADNLEAVLAVTRARIAAAPRQETLDLEKTP